MASSSNELCEGRCTRYALWEAYTSPVLFEYVGAQSQILNHVAPMPALAELAAGLAADM